LAQLSTEISEDREVHVYSKDVLPEAHVIGEGFIDEHETTDADMIKDTEVEPLLFVNETNENVLDQEYFNEVVQEDQDLSQSDDLETEFDSLKWLNGLGDQIVSYSFKTLSISSSTHN